MAQKIGYISYHQTNIDIKRILVATGTEESLDSVVPPVKNPASRFLPLQTIGNAEQSSFFHCY